MYRYICESIILINSIIVALFLTGCSPKQVIKQEPAKATLVQQQPSISTIAGDTFSYVVGFNDNSERDNFLTRIDHFLKDYPFAKVQSTENNGVQIKVLPAKDSGAQKEQTQSISNERSQYIGNIIQKAVDTSVTDTPSQPAPESDTIVPQHGGTARIFIQRGSLDETFGQLVTINPFSNRYNVNILTITDSSAKKITLQLNGKIINGSGKILSALDIIDSWISLIKNYPAEGLALFRYVDGVKELIEGREVIVRGLIATNQSTIQIKLTQPDQYVLERLRTARLLPANLKLGNYIIDTQTGNDLTLLTNKPSAREYGYLDKVVIRTGGDPNPVLSYSLKKYDAITLSGINDIEYARQNLLKSSALDIVSNDRYFISCNSNDLNLRKYLRSIVHPSDMLKYSIKSAGDTITSIEETQIDSNEITGESIRPSTVPPIKILFRKDDPISKVIAEKILADMSQANINGSLNGVTQTEYDRLLVSKNYICAVGWVPQTVTSDISEKLRLATIWFGDDTNEVNRISNYLEIPLFSIHRYLLTRNPLVMPDSKITDIYMKQ